MKILKCKIANFGCYKNKVIDFNLGLNTLCADNGYGKTTLTVFIKSMLYSLQKSTQNSYERKHYMPYDGDIYGGSMDIKIGDDIYTIERMFKDTPSKDSLKIYDKMGLELKTFLDNKVEDILKGEPYSLGELILGVNEEGFLKCNFISSQNLDFSSNESIKRKIGNIVIDKGNENSYEETISNIEMDLRDKKPTKKGENAYPYKIKEIEKENKEINNKINNIKSSLKELDELYITRNNIDNELKEIVEMQKEYAELYKLKGMESTVSNFNTNIAQNQNIIDNINNKYHNELFSEDEIKTVITECENIDKYITIEQGFELKDCDFIRMSKLQNNHMSNEEYELLLISSNNIKKQVKLEEYDKEKYTSLNNKFSSKNIKDENDLDMLYKNYLNSKDNKDEYIKKDVIDDSVIDEVLEEIDSYNAKCLDLNNFKNSFKEKTTIIKIILSIFTLGIYFIISSNKKQKYNRQLAIKNSDVNSIANKLDDFFLKYNAEGINYITKFKTLKKRNEENIEYNKNHKESNDKINKEFIEYRAKLIEYFSNFYDGDDIESIYAVYKEELKEYNEFCSLIKRNDKIIENYNVSINEEKNNINTILKKYNMQYSDNFFETLKNIKLDIDFYNKKYDIYQNKKKNDCEKNKSQEKIKSIFNKHNIKCDDLLSSAKGLCLDVKALKEALEAISNLKLERDKFIKENNLEKVIGIDIAINEEGLRENREELVSRLNDIEKNIMTYEENLSKIDELNEKINENNEKIKVLNEKVRIAKISRKKLEEAELAMEEKFIYPVKNTFIRYANKIHQKIASNVYMGYDYEISYDVCGIKRSSADLSEGERCIMMLALRFSIIDSMYENHDTTIILDDPFSSLDEEKMLKAKELIKELSKYFQILYFTCHESREIK